MPITNFSFYFPDTVSNPTMGAPNAQVGDGRPYLAAEWCLIESLLWCKGQANRGVAKGALNECAVTVLGANSLQVDTGLVVVNGGGRVLVTAQTLAPTSAPGGTTRKDSVIAEFALDASGSGGAPAQYTVNVYTKAGTAGAPPAMTQTAVIWQQRLYDYTIDDAGAITGLTDQRQYLRSATEQDHGDLAGLADDDHTQYYNAARHTKAVHDALNIDAETVDGYHAADFLAGVAVGFLGCTVLWGGAIGGSDGHRPIVGGVANEAWHLANGETVNGVVTLDSRDRMPIGAGSTYAVNASGGAATANLAHTHTYSAATSWDGSHTHGVSIITNPESSHTHPAGLTDSAAGGAAIDAWDAAGDSGPGSAHGHQVNGNTAAGGSHNHTAAGTTASGGSAAQSVLNPYRGFYFITFVG